METIKFLIDFVLHIDKHLGELMIQHGPWWMYGIIFLIIFIETGVVFMPFLPGDSLLFASGALWAATGNNIFLLYTIIVFGSVLISGFVDNIPYVATMLPVITSITSHMQIEPYLLYYGLLIGATLGGNITPIGASANIAGIGLLRKNGYEVSFSQFMKIGVPFTFAAVLAGYLFIWFVWK